MDLICTDIKKSYGNVVALKDADFKLAGGEIRAILGGNGSGKSTLAKILGGVIQRDGGEIYIDNKPYNVKNPRQAKRQHVVITSQELSLLMNLSIEENLSLTGLPTKSGVLLDRQQMRKRALDMLEYLGMKEQADENVCDLPPNKQYLVEFAKALMQEPELLVVDEITSALFREDVEVVSRVFRDLSKKGCSIIFITHRIPEIFSMCPTVTIMRNGETIGTFETNAVSEHYLLALLSGRTPESADEGGKEKERVSGDECDSKELLSVKGLKLKRFNSSIDFSIRRGEIIGIAGLQGQGQSDFVRTLFALNGPQTLVFDGTAMKITSPESAVKAGLAYVSGDRTKEGAFYGRSIEENVICVNNEVLQREKLDTQGVLRELTVKYTSKKLPIESLSGGNQQKVIIGRWTSTRPKLILADDLTKGIDVSARHDIHCILNELAKTGSSVLYVSSDESELEALATIVDHAKCVVFYEGNIVKTLVGSEITLENIITYSLPVSGGGLN